MKIMLDSGAYSAYQKNIKIDIDQYIEFVRNNGQVFEVCVNLDVIGDGRGSYENWMYLRRNGIDTMPVYHIGTDEIWLQKYLSKCDYIGIGAIANLSPEKRFHGLNHMWDKYLNDSQCKVHGMGLSAIDILVKYPWHSVDSTSPIMQAAYGGIYLPLIQAGRFNYLKLSTYKISNDRRTTASYFLLPASIRKVYEQHFELLTLAGPCLRRTLWNLDMWARMAESINNKMTVYVGVGNPPHFKEVINRDLGSLLSFFYVNTDKQLDNYLKSNIVKIKTRAC